MGINIVSRVLIICTIVISSLVPFSPAHAQAISKEQLLVLQQEAKDGNAVAQYNLGTMYYSGQGLPRNDEEAIKWYRKAAERGHMKAQYNLGVKYNIGEGVAKNDAQAVKWYRKAAE